VNYEPAYVQAALAAARFRSQNCAIHFHLSQADRDDLYQTILLDALERSSRFDPAKGSASTFAGRVALNAANDFLNDLKRVRDYFIAADQLAANDPDFDLGTDPFDGGHALWADDNDGFFEAEALCDLQSACSFMTEAQQGFLNQLAVHADLPSACRATGYSTPTFYRRVTELRLHLRMFGFAAAA
jgi:DNA-directed RNA polymerase specialized sigma24 family protein